MCRPRHGRLHAIPPLPFIFSWCARSHICTHSFVPLSGRQCSFWCAKLQERMFLAHGEANLTAVPQGFLVSSMQSWSSGGVRFICNDRQSDMLSWAVNALLARHGRLAWAIHVRNLVERACARIGMNSVRDSLRRCRCKVGLHRHGC